jgi:hypothetical protein
MKYFIKINPEKERECLRLLQALKDLGIIEQLRPANEQRSHAGQACQGNLWPGGAIEERNDGDWAEPYKDLVD